MIEINKYISLLEKLYKNSLETSTELAEQLHISRQTVSKMRKFLWNTKIINSSTILMNPHVLNLQNFFIEVKTNPSEPEILNKLLKIKEISSIDGVLGDYSLIIKFEVPTKKKFADILTQIEQKLSISLFSSYRIIECLDIFKIGGFILERDYPVINIYETGEKWKILQLLKKNSNFRRWPDRKNSGEQIFTKKEREFLERKNLSREFNRYQSDKIIQRFTISLNNQRFKEFLRKNSDRLMVPNFQTKFYVQIKPKKISQYSILPYKLMHNPNIIDLYRTGNEAGLLLVVRTKNLVEFNDWINKLYINYSIKDTHTIVVVDEIKSAIYPPTLKIAKEVCKTSEDK